MVPIAATASESVSPWNYLERQSGSRTEINQVSARQSESKAITIKTAEGDTVTLSFSQQSEMDYLGYQHLGYQKALAWGDQGAMGQWQRSSLAGEQLYLGHNSELSISVEGDLSAEELEDITQAVQAVDKMMQGLLYGDKSGQGVTALKDLDLDTLAGIKADYSYSREVRVQRLTHEAHQYSHQGVIQSRGVGRVRGPFAEQMDRLINPLVRQIGAADIEPRHLEKPLGRLFKGYQNNLNTTDSRYQSQKEILEMIQETFFQRLETYFESSFGEVAPDH